MTAMHYLESIENPNQRISCRSFYDALMTFYAQWRAYDGSIPWVIFSEGQTITEEDLRT
jgi:hypothetical protein